VWDSWSEFERELPQLGQPFFFSTKGKQMFWDAPLGGSSDVVLVFGRETGGLPAAIHQRYRDRMLTIPMLSEHVRSLNLSTAIGIVLFEVLRQRRSSDA
jgi:tRNA (cytidine/uridine-2'-O-)-methyltransferase